MTNSQLFDLRSDYHRKICADVLGHRLGSIIYSNADGSNPTSVDLAARVAAKMGYPPAINLPSGQGSGSLFTTYTKEFLEAAFSRLHHLRPGTWTFSMSQKRPGIAQFEQYEHLAHLEKILEEHKELKVTLGGDYFITPDITVSRSPLADAQINADSDPPILEAAEELARHTPLRAANRSHSRKTLHASISCKWTIRSDRAQNSRTEALNLIRNRKGRTPFIAVVMFEPLPARIASIAMGTGDIDCTYHGALYELLEAAKEGGHNDAHDLLENLVNGRRLRDISDLPFDLVL